jgi:hypothetical protein
MSQAFLKKTAITLICLSLSTELSPTWAMNDDTEDPKYPLTKLSKLEKDFWDSLKERRPHKEKTSGAVKNITDPKAPIAPSAEIDFTGMAKWEIVKHLDEVQEKKHSARDGKIKEIEGTPKKKYNTRYHRLGTGDPSPEKIKFQGRQFSMSFNYDGNPRTQQPGNFHFIENMKLPLVYTKSEGINIDNPDAQLLLLGEISRRHARDPIRKIDDEFKDLPVGLGLAMASRLIEDNSMQLEAFWLKGHQYHMYSGDENQRKVAIFEIYKLYSQKYMNTFSEEEKDEHLQILMETHFEVPSEDISEDFKNLFLSEEEQEEN